MSEFDDLLKRFDTTETELKEEQKKPDILIIDDDESMRRGLKSALTYKYDVTTVDNGKAGIEALNKAFHCVILDVKMQGMSGFEIYPKLKEKCPSIPIVFCTAFQSEHDLQEIINKYKPEGYIEKGRDISFLEHLIENAIKKYHLILENEEYKRDLEKKVAERTEQYRNEKERAEQALIAQKKAEEERAKALALSKTATLAAGISHDVINAISTGSYKIADVKINLNIILKALDQLSENNDKEVASFLEQKKIHTKLSKINNNIDGIGDSMQKVLYFSRILKGYSDKDRSNFKEISVNQILSKILSEKKEEYRDLNIDCQMKHKDEKIYGDSTGIYFVFQNILENAYEAMKNQNNKQLWISVEKFNKQLIISFRDNGPGMKKEVSEQIFDPHYSTKGVSSVGHNRGLGLFTAKQTINGHLGQIEIKTKVHEGSEFIISLPLKK
jgi:signal transduction histidine kinase